jgi:hypothetical protein
MLPVSLDCSFLIALSVFSKFICPVSIVPYVASFSGLFIFDCPFGILSGQINLENTERAIKNEQSRETSNIGYNRHRTNKLREYGKGNQK